MMQMHKKRFHFFREVTKKTKRIFRARNIIIVSDQTLEHMPLSGIMQVLILVGVLGFFSGVSYLTGSYMNARHTIREKEKTIARTRQEKLNINDEMTLLKRDMNNFSRSSKDLASSTKFMTDHFASAAAGTPASGTVSPLFGQSADKLSLRVAYLENHIKQMQDENDQLMSAIRNRADKKIELFEDIIAMTGLDADRLENHATAKTRAESGKSAAAIPANAQTDGKVAPAPVVADNDSQGGPFITDRASLYNEDHRDLMVTVDRLVLLHDIIDKLPLSSPISGAHTTSAFGRRVDPFNGRVAIHPGIDFAAPYGTKVYAASAGKVTFAARKAAYGNAIDVNHGFGIVTRYGHLSKILVKEGDKVRKGQLIGLEGSTGRSTGAHLHYEVRIDDHPVNPAKFLEAGEYVSEK